MLLGEAFMLLAAVARATEADSVGFPGTLLAGVAGTVEAADSADWPGMLLTGAVGTVEAPTTEVIGVAGAVSAEGHSTERHSEL